MTRRLPWERDSVNSIKNEIKSEARSPRSLAPPRTPARSTPQPPRALTSRPSERKPPASARNLSHRPDRSPSTSPPPQPIPETFLIPGYDHDDIYRMVEDEFLIVAGKFTAHLHAAEYHRLKTEARSQNADVIANISRPVVGSLTELARQRQEDLLRSKKQRQALKGAEAGDMEEEDDALWGGSSLRGLMDSPRKREVKISALGRGDWFVRAGDVAGRTEGSRDKMEGVQRKLEFTSGRPAKRPRPDETEDEDEDDLDVQGRGKSTIKATTKTNAANDERDTDSEEDDIFTRFKSRQTSDRQRRPAVKKDTKGKGRVDGDIIPSFIS
ncbi:hypothetical protein ACHAQH_006125 [Verticillium albo-atrum]